jgi:excisionase family DNA binding protein
MWLSDDDIKKLAFVVAQHVKRHLAESGGQSKAPQPRLMTVEETAIYLGRTKSAIEHLVHNGGLDGCLVRKNRRVHVDRFALDKWCETHRV